MGFSGINSVISNFSILASDVNIVGQVSILFRDFWITGCSHYFVVSSSILTVLHQRINNEERTTKLIFIDKFVFFFIEADEQFFHVYSCSIFSLMERELSAYGQYIYVKEQL